MHVVERISAFDLPEIRCHLASFLPLRGLAACARVSRDWNESFEPWIWRDLSILPVKLRSNPKDILSYPHLLRHCSTIKRLACAGSDKRYLKVMSCPGLQVLALHWIQKHQPSFVLRHASLLTSLSFDLQGFRNKEQNEQASDALYKAAASCLNLETLSATRTTITKKSWPGFWSLVSTRLTTLRLRMTAFRIPEGKSDNDDDDDTTTAPFSFSSSLRQDSATRIKILELSSLEGITCLDDHLALLKACPDLKSLLWYPSNEHFESEELGRHLLDQAAFCPKLKSLNINLDDDQDRVLPFLEARAKCKTTSSLGPTCTPLQELSLTGQSFNVRSLRFVQENFGLTLRSLILTNSFQVTGEMIQEMLCTLSKLETLAVPCVQDTVLVDDSRPWTCLGLRHLIIGVEFTEAAFEEQVETERDDEDSNRVASSSPPSSSFAIAYHTQVMERIGTLTSLESLILNTCFKCYDWSSHQFLQFRLDRGLERLRDLRRLEILDMNWLRVDLDQDDVRWMLDHWPKLRYLYGALSQDLGRDAILGKLLEDRGVLREAPSPRGVHVC
ncbi:hypothetical protein BGZ83_010979 [Gryganskiella cystojenkinii]|nr:hypothetical protein BGZ83_010979 [Gryganskiella cystojenkinii]